MIQIKAISYNGMPYSSLSAEFDELGGDIGRAEDNTLVLPDPDKHISRLHATVNYRRGQYHICNHGSATPVILNGRALEKDQSEVIAPGDEIRIGGYTLQVMADDRAVNSLFTNSSMQASASDFSNNFFAQPAGNSSGAEQHPSEQLKEFVDYSNKSDKSDFFADPFSRKPSPAMSELIPENYDPFAGLPASDGLSKNSDPAMKHSLLDESALSVNDQHIDAFIHTKNPVDELSAQPDMRDIDPLMILEGAANKAELPEFHLQRDDALELHGAFEPPKRQSEASVKQNTRAIMAEEISGQNFAIGDLSLLEAFLTGAGMQGRNPSVKLTPEFMYRMGLILRTSTQGTLDLLLARAMAKQEMRANMTLIAPKENNPLKFSPDVETALTHLLTQQGKGFMTPEEAIKDAYEDLRSHQFGFMAGMRAALAGLLEKFKPSGLERRFTKVTLMDKLVPSSRKAKFWDSYTDRYEEISREAEEDFHIFFSKEFLKAYEQQIEKFNDED